MSLVLFHGYCGYLSSHRRALLVNFKINRNVVWKQRKKKQQKNVLLLTFLDVLQFISGAAAKYPLPKIDRLFASTNTWYRFRVYVDLFLFLFFSGATQSGHRLSALAPTYRLKWRRLARRQTRRRRESGRSGRVIHLRPSATTNEAV